MYSSFQIVRLLLPYGPPVGPPGIRMANRKRFSMGLEYFQAEDKYFRTSLPNLKIPALILWGRQDRLIPVSAAELFKAAAAVDVTHIPFKGSAPSVLALVAGQIDLSFSTVVIVLPQVNAYRLRALAVTSPRRSKVMATLPTMMEAGMAGVESQQWFALFGPAGLPKEIVSQLNVEATRIIQLPEIRERLANEGAEAGTLTQLEFASFLQADAARWARVIKESGAKAE